MSSFVTSLIRTWTPILAGAILGWAITVGLPVTQADKAGLTAVLTAVAGGLYYLAVRSLERRWPALGWLLGKPAAPVYLAPKQFVAMTVPVGDPVVGVGGSGVTYPLGAGGGGATTFSGSSVSGVSTHGGAGSVTGPSVIGVPPVTVPDVVTDPVPLVTEPPPEVADPPTTPEGP
jgi:hypothetical protein